ncbi:MAG TPA: SH3 domain-containing protein [Candidatus Krumholzibacteria bacterium]|nr:SH3 domain-containing protein [Candidatus Krumholzibacteria bacterium]
MTNKHRRGWAVAALVLAAGLALAALPQRSVQVRSGQLRETPGFLGRIVGELAYGDRLEVLEAKNGWSRVRDAAGRTGWVHDSALTEKKVVLTAGTSDAGTGASGQEIALAGKGFSEEVEKAYRGEHPDLDYTWVDRMASFTVSPEASAAFVREGGLAPAEGGAR